MSDQNEDLEDLTPAQALAQLQTALLKNYRHYRAHSSVSHSDFSPLDRYHNAVDMLEFLKLAMLFVNDEQVMTHRYHRGLGLMLQNVQNEITQALQAQNRI